MKKLIALVVGLCLAVGLYAQQINPKVGYTNGITWGMKRADVNKKLPTGEKLQKMSKTQYSPTDDGYIDTVEVYYTQPKKDSSVILVLYFFLNDSLFQLSETLKPEASTEQKLKARYVGLTTATKAFDFWDRSVAADGYITMSVGITIIKEGNLKGEASVMLLDWETYKKAVTFDVAEYDTSALSIVSGLGDLAKKLVQSSSSKATYAFIALTSDDGNALVENYVTDALTEAMFETGKIKIVERASIEKIMSEQKFQSSALVNENTAVEIGNLSGANFVCYGTVKDLGAQISLNVKVVEVSTAELCAMGRETVNKDKYLQSVGFEKRKGSGNGVASASGNAEAEKKEETTTVKKVSNNQWKCETVRNDFDDCTVYTFTVTTPDNYMCLVGLKKYDNPIYSKAVAGVGKTLYYTDADIKSGSGPTSQTIKKRLHWEYNWYLNGHDGNKYEIRSGEEKSTKWFFDIFLNSEIVTIRDGNNKIAKFQTAGLEEKMAEYGLTPQDFYDAYDNENF